MACGKAVLTRHFVQNPQGRAAGLLQKFTGGPRKPWDAPVVGLITSRDRNTCTFDSGSCCFSSAGVAAPAFADRRSDAKAQVDFGITVAQRGLWKEAAYRWEKAVEVDPTYAAAWNNLGIGYEQLGRFDDARKAYEKALELEPGNTFIRSNYDLFREIYDRQNRRRDR